MEYLAEFYLPAGEADLADLALRARSAAAAMAGSGRAVRFVRAMHAVADESCFAWYEADAADIVVAAGLAAGLTVDRVVEIDASDAG
jgi:hypothetical protein